MSAMNQKRILHVGRDGNTAGRMDEDRWRQHEITQLIGE
jgi:hypothetical protein